MLAPSGTRVARRNPRGASAIGAFEIVARGHERIAAQPAPRRGPSVEIGAFKTVRLHCEGVVGAPVVVGEVWSVRTERRPRRLPRRRPLLRQARRRLLRRCRCRHRRRRASSRASRRRPAATTGTTSALPRSLSRRWTRHHRDRTAPLPAGAQQPGLRHAGRQDLVAIWHVPPRGRIGPARERERGRVRIEEPRPRDGIAILAVLAPVQEDVRERVARLRRRLDDLEAPAARARHDRRFDGWSARFSRRGYRFQDLERDVERRLGRHPASWRA